MTFGKRCAFALVCLFGLCFLETDAIRGTNQIRRTKEESTVVGDTVNRQRRTAQWKGIATPSHAAVARIPKLTHKTQGDHKSSDKDDEDYGDEIPVIQDTKSNAKKGNKSKESKGTKGTKVDKGSAKESDDESNLDTLDCDDPSDPACYECDDPSDPRCNPAEEAEAQPEESTIIFNLAQTVQRAIPPFEIGYTLPVALNDDNTDDGDYAELAETTELHLTTFFLDYFETEPTNFYEVNVTVQKTDDLSIVRFFVTASFVVPGKLNLVKEYLYFDRHRSHPTWLPTGEVPTMQTMFDRLTEAFSGTLVREYALLLKDMGSENPFRDVRSIALITTSPGEAKEATNSTKDDDALVKNKARLYTLIFLGVMMVSIIGMLSYLVHRRHKLIKEVRRLQLEDDEKRNVNATSYLDSIREQYRDEDDVTTDVFNTDDDDDDAMTQATDNRQTLGELRDAMNALELLVSHDTESLQGTHHEAPSSVDQANSPSANVEYMNYLDLQASFEEEDLRT